MFKKGKKAQVVKFDDEGENNQNNEASQALMNDISQMKAKENKKIENSKKNKTDTKISFDEDDSVGDNLVYTKKSLYQKPKEQETEEIIEIKKEGNQTYTKDYLEELRAFTKKSNQNVMDKFSAVIDMDDLIEDKKDEDEKSEIKELNLADIEAEEGDENVVDNEIEIENAKKYREKKRKLNSGEYISMTKENAELEESAANAEKLRIQQRILDNKTKTPKNEDDEYLDFEEQEELDNWQNKILKNTINPNTRTQIDKFLKKEYNKDSSRVALDNKSANKKIDLDFLLKGLEENIKTEEAYYQDSIQRVTKFMNLLTVSNEEISAQQKTYASGDNKIDLVQDLSDFFSILSDCLAEKGMIIEEVELKLDEVESNYGKLLYENVAFYICDELERTGSNPTTFSNDDMNKRRKGEKLERHFEPVRELNFTNIREKIIFILSSENSPFTFNSFSKPFTDIQSDKSTLFNVSQEIFADVDEEYISLPGILDKFCTFSEFSNASHEKIQEWFTECFSIFFRIDLIGFDPFGLSENSLIYHQNANFLDLISLKQIIPEIDTKILSNQKVELKQKLSIFAFSKLLDEVIFDKLKNIISKLWNPFSPQETVQLTRSLDTYIQTYYVNNYDKNAGHIAKIKELLLKITDKLTQFIEILTFPNNCESAVGYYILNLAIKLFRNTFLFKKILPNTTIFQVAFDNLLVKKLLIPLNDFDILSQVKLFANIFVTIPEDILKPASNKPEFTEIKNRVKRIMDNPLISSGNFSDEKNEIEEIQRDLRVLKTIIA